MKQQIKELCQFVAAEREPLDTAQLAGRSSCGCGGQPGTPRWSHREPPPAPESHNNTVSSCNTRPLFKPLTSHFSFGSQQFSYIFLVIKASVITLPLKLCVHSLSGQ